MKDQPHEHDLGLAHDLKVLSRRGMFQLAGAAGASALVAACAGGTSQQATGSASTATTTAGAADAAACAAAAPPRLRARIRVTGRTGRTFSSNRVSSAATSGRASGSSSGAAEGVPAAIELTVQDITKDCATGAGMAVYIWHCDRAGNYSLYSQDAAEQNYLRGVQVADQDGRASFTSIFPACYAGRWPHIHFEVFDSLGAAVAGENARLTSQIALPEQACTAVFGYDTGYAASVPTMSRVTLSSDNVFGDGWDAELATVTGDPAGGMTIALTIGVGEKSTSTPPPGGLPRRGGPPGGPPPNGRPPGPPPPR